MKILQVENLKILQVENFAISLIMPCTNNIVKFKDQKFNIKAKKLHNNYKEIIIYFNRMISTICSISNEVRKPQYNLEALFKKDLARHYYTSKEEIKKKPKRISKWISKPKSKPKSQLKQKSKPSKIAKTNNKKSI